MCHYRHNAHGDPFFYPGLQDITSHINFTGIAEAGTAKGMEIAGYCNQGSFLLSLGLLDIFEQECTNSESRVSEMSLSQQVKKLTLPHEMGELFKVMALTRNNAGHLRGFSMHNHKGRL